MTAINLGRRLAICSVAAGMLATVGTSVAFAQQPSGARVYRVSSFDGTSRSFLGVGIAEIDAERAKVLKLKEERGVEITRVDDESPAAQAGIKQGDVVLEYNGQRVEGMDQFARFVRETPVGREVKLSISRDGKPQVVNLKVGSKKTGGLIASMPRSVEIPEIRMPDFPRGGAWIWSSSMLGIESEGISGQLAEFFGVKEGVLVRSVGKGTAAEKAGVRAGDVITKVDGTAVDSPSDITRALRASKNRKSLAIVLMRDKKEMTVTASIEDSDSRGGEMRLNRGAGKSVSYDGKIGRF